MTRKLPQAQLPGRLVALAGIGALLVVSSPGWSQATAAPLFPRPFVVEHAVAGRSADGTDLGTPSVIDYYGGSWIVSVRPDKSRLVVDFDRREITEIKPKDSTYSIVSFDRFAELRRRLRQAQQPSAGTMSGTVSSSTLAAPAKAPEFVVDEVTAKEDMAASTMAAGSEAEALAARAGVRHLRVSVHAEAASKHSNGRGVAGPSLEVWLDPTVTLAAPAMAALARFDVEVLNAGASANRASFSGMLAAAREKTGGAFPIRTLHPATLTGGATTAGGVEDVASRLAYVEKFPLDLLKVPSGYRRVAQPLEAMVAYLEAEAQRALTATKAPAK
ncbi:MAG: hypothetical protein ACHQQS_16330 [Thermoanaerobaculales bacterium]